ncbi:MAG: 3-methyl-2-oxobutanoate hydroxymethyltransferase [Candidatus Omnitrophica bacterium]|nr:3-methyl-2-oxobutanoate hydroxymethyltransferase [Candidatus Omnitrophota bacterium]
MNKVKVKDILAKKAKQKITVLTCYDYSFARILDASGIDIILVGDSLANVVLGLKETREVTIAEMLNHTQAVARGVARALVVADMPYASYQKDPAKCLYYAKKFIAHGADAVKIEWFSKCPQVVKKLIKNKIPVVGHIGLTPQTAHLLGGYKVQGKDDKSAKDLFNQAKLLEDLGVFSLVLECIPLSVSRQITKSLKIPTIGIGAGKYCDGQVLVLYDFLGLYPGKELKFVRRYKSLGQEVHSATLKFIQDVKNGQFPSTSESFPS